MSLKEQMESTASRVNDFILSMLEGKPKELYLASSHYVKSGGKRLRPFMVIKSCELLGGSAEKTLPVAATIEMVHNFTLIQDDVMDNDEVRHNVPTVHRNYGLPLAILASDILFSKAFQILATYSGKAGLPNNVIVELIAKLAKSCLDVSEGQALDVDMASSSKFSSESQYINMIDKKTATLFETACELGAICAQTSKRDISNLAKFGRNIGIAFQLVDDLIGVAGDPKVTKKPVGNDIREGKKTLPILLAIKKAKGEGKDKMLNVFGSKNVTESELKEAVNVLTSIGVDREVRNMARVYATKAVKSIKMYKDSKAKHALQSLADFVVERIL
ncbi:MAG: polyprenyl synthetase family protein [Nitrososphaerales archaeon]